jgi:hypothetical protein
MKAILIIIEGICYLIGFGILVYIGIYSFRHDSLTHIQLFKFFYKEYIIMILFFLIPYFFMIGVKK